LAKRGPGIHHLMFSVADVRAVAKDLKMAGFRMTPDGPIDEGHHLTWFVHPRDAEGILVELGQPLR
jgi:methylmalonyl-CoA/ethylmalonyl-CoA epimerase